MEDFIIYLLKATICITAFGVFFRLLLMRETFFRFTRFSLLIGLVVCCILPLIKIEINPKSYDTGNFFLIEYLTQINNTFSDLSLSSKVDTPPYTIGNEEVQAVMTESRSERKEINWLVIIVYLYWLGVALMLVRLGISLIRLQTLFKKSRVIKQDNHLLVICKEDIAPFSFFKYIAMSEEDYKNNPVEIILHESIHILKGHNLDLILSELLLVLHWFNPIMWMLNRDLREIHEYETDNAVIAEGISAQKYQLLLVKKAVGEKQFSSVVNSFNQSKLKNRITMMLKTKSTPLARLKVLLAVPLVAIALFGFATVDASNEQNDNQLERQKAANFFMSIKSIDDDYDAYLYLNTKNYLYLMTNETDSAMINSIDINDMDNLYESFVEIIDRTAKEKNSNTISIALGADDDNEMKSITIVRDAIRKSFDKWQSTISDDDKETHNKSQMMVLSLKLLSATVSQEISTTDQVKANPLFYLQQAHEYFKNKGIQPKDITKTLEGMNKNIIPILVNSINQTMIRNYKVNNPNELNSDNTIDALKSIIVNEWVKQKGEFVFYIQYDNTTNSDVIMQIMKHTLPSAYDLAIQEISDKDNITLEEVKYKMPLLLISANDKKYNPSQSKNASEAETKVSLHYVSGISEETKLVINQNVDSTFPSNIEQSIQEYKDKYGVTEISNLIVKLGINVDLDKIRELEKCINKELDVKHIGYLLMTP